MGLVPHATRCAPFNTRTGKSKAMTPLSIEDWTRAHVVCVVTGTVDMLISAEWNAPDDGPGDMDTIHEALSAAQLCVKCDGQGEVGDTHGDGWIKCPECDGVGRHEHPISHVLVSDRLGHWLRQVGEGVAGWSMFDADIIGVQGDAKVWVRVGSGQEWCADSVIQAAYQAMASSQARGEI